MAFVKSVRIKINTKAAKRRCSVKKLLAMLDPKTLKNTSEDDVC